MEQGRAARAQGFLLALRFRKVPPSAPGGVSQGQADWPQVSVAVILNTGCA